MYYGKMTDELDRLYAEYENIFDCEPSYYEELEYGQSDYKDYVEDIKKAIKEKKALPYVADVYIEDDW